MTEIKNSLMKKKKAELVAIILRKDDVEKELRVKVNDLEGKSATLENTIDILKDSYKNERIYLNNDNEALKSDLAELNEQLAKKNKLIAELNEDCDIMRDNVTIFQKRIAKGNIKMFILAVAITTIATAIIWGINLFM